MTIDPSDVALALDLILAMTLAIYFAAGRPRVWYRSRLGWVIFSYALAVVALLALIVYGVVLGQRVEEPLRLFVGVALGAALIAKTWSIHQERRASRLPDEHTGYEERAPIMSNAAPLTVGETVSSAEPKVTLGKSKAVIAAVAGGIVAAGGVLITALSDGAISAGEVYAIIGAGLAGAGIPGFGAFLTPTTVRRNV